MENSISAEEQLIQALDTALGLAKRLKRVNKGGKVLPPRPNSAVISESVRLLYSSEVSLNTLAEMLKEDHPEISLAAARSRMQRERKRRNDTSRASIR